MIIKNDILQITRDMEMELLGLRHDAPIPSYTKEKIQTKTKDIIEKIDKCDINKEFKSQIDKMLNQLAHNDDPYYDLDTILSSISSLRSMIKIK